MAESKAEQLKARAKRFAIQVVFLCRTLPRSDEGWILGKQLLKAPTSVAANYRAVCRARSKAEFVAKIGVVVEEADETAFWLELLEECSVVPKDKVKPILSEANELLAIFAASQRTARTSSMDQ